MMPTPEDRAEDEAREERRRADTGAALRRAYTELPALDDRFAELLRRLKDARAT